MTKTCTSCCTEKNVSSFYPAKRGLLGVRGECKSCVLAKNKLYRDTNQDVIRTGQKRRYELDREVRLKKSKKHRIENKIRYNEYFKTRRKFDLQFRIAGNLRNRLRQALNNDAKVGSAVKNLGCTVAQLKVYLESKFQPGMTWDNWSVTGWHIDHIVPLSSFDLTKASEIQKACHYSNLSPLWSIDNIRKSNYVY